MKTGNRLIRLFFRAAELLTQKVSLFMAFLLISLSGNSLSLNRSSSFPDTIKLGRSLPDERVLLIPDRKIYLCGEDIVFEAFTYEGSVLMPIASAAILYAELYSTDNRVISKGKYFLENGKGSGSITIPRETLSGIYFIRAYTNFMKNFGTGQFFVAKLKIVNPFPGGKNLTTPPAASIETGTIEDRLNSPSELLKISIETDRKEYGNRELINVKIKTKDKDGNPVKTGLTLLSVLTSDDLSDPEVNAGIQFTATEQKFDGVKASGIRYLPEIKGDIVSGRAVYEDNQPAAGIRVLQSFTGSSTRIESSITDNEGRFYFLTDMEKNRGRLILKVNTEARKIDIIPDDEFFNDFAPPVNETFGLTDDEIKLISKEFVNIQVEDAFPGQNTIEKGETDVETAFYGKDFTEYKFPEYLKLPNMKEFIFEVIEGVVYSRENRKDILSIHETATMNKIGPNPLMVIDGVPVTDASVILGLPSEKVQSIRVVRNKYLYKDQAFDGILDIVTFKNDASSVKFNDDTFRLGFVHPETGPRKKEVRIFSDEKGKIPNYKNLLYWNSGITTDNNGNAEISFTSPDNSGTFSIRCFGFSPDGIFGKESINIVIGEK